MGPFWPTGRDGSSSLTARQTPLLLRTSAWPAICIVLRYICLMRDNPGARFGVYFYWMVHGTG